MTHLSLEQCLLGPVSAVYGHVFDFSAPAREPLHEHGVWAPGGGSGWDCGDPAGHALQCGCGGGDTRLHPGGVWWTLWVARPRPHWWVGRRGGGRILTEVFFSTTTPKDIAKLKPLVQWVKDFHLCNFWGGSGWTEYFNSIDFSCGKQPYNCLCLSVCPSVCMFIGLYVTDSLPCCYHWSSWSLLQTFISWNACGMYVSRSKGQRLITGSTTLNANDVWGVWCFFYLIWPGMPCGPRTWFDQWDIWNC